MDELYFYIIRNKDGRYFRRKGYGGWGDSWVGDIEKARTYNKIGSARTVVTYFARQYPQYGVPDIICYKATYYKTMDEKERINNTNIKIAKRKQNRYIKRKKEEIKRLEEDLKKTEEKLKNLKGV